MDTIEIIKLNGSHELLLAQTFLELNSPGYIYKFSPHPFTAEYASKICNYQGLDLYFAILLNKNHIIAYFMLRGWDEGYEIPAVGLCVLNEFHGKGLGRLIMHFLETTAKFNGASKIMLKVRNDNHVAETLYITQGYEFNKYNNEFLIGYKELNKKQRIATV
jgi:GNAT superfamily N-acetyltransferase